MRINPVANSIQRPTFGVNLKSPKLKFQPEDFFIKIEGYGKDEAWANVIIEYADLAVNYIRRGLSPENVLKCVTAGVRKANQNDENNSKRADSGILRDIREGWLHENKEYLSNDIKLLTHYADNKYDVYKERLDKVYRYPLKPINDDIGMTTMNNFHCMVHGNWKKVNDSLEYIFKLSEKIFPKYIKEEVKPEDLDEINSIIAEIRWVLAHSTPWYRGSDAISNVFMRALYKSIGIKAYPPAEGVSFDLEAYCTNLDDYKAKFTTYFERPPEIAE